MAIKKVILICGQSGTGKDTFAHMLSDLSGWDILCSYTTRPKRPDEVDGREHHFVESHDLDAKERGANVKELASCMYGGHLYWATVDQLKDNTVYVVDAESIAHIEEVLVELEEQQPDNIYSVTKILVQRDPVDRLLSGVGIERLKRDSLSYPYNIHFFDYVVNNDGTTADLWRKAADVVLRVERIVCNSKTNIL